MNNPVRKTDGRIICGMKGNTCPSCLAKVEIKISGITEMMASNQMTKNKMKIVSLPWSTDFIQTQPYENKIKPATEVQRLPCRDRGIF